MSILMSKVVNLAGVLSSDPSDEMALLNAAVRALLFRVETIPQCPPEDKAYLRAFRHRLNGEHCEWPS